MAADDGAVAVKVCVDGDGAGQSAGGAGVAARIAGVTFVEGPTVVLAAVARGGLVIDLLDLTLADVPDEEIAGGAIEAEAPGIAQPIGPDLGARARLVDKGVAGWDGILPAHRSMVHVDAQDLPEQGGLPLAVR